MTVNIDLDSFKNYQDEKKLDWPSQSSGLKPIEHLWKELLIVQIQIICGKKFRRNREKIDTIEEEEVNRTYASVIYTTLRKY